MTHYRQALFLIGMSVFIGVVVSVHWALVTGSLFMCFCAIYPKKRSFTCSFTLKEITKMLDGGKITINGGPNILTAKIDEDVSVQLHDYYVRKN